MIRFFDEKDRLAVISIWQEAFGDDIEEISIFLKFLKNDILVFEKDGKAVSMLALLPVCIGADKGRYIYAVATDKAYRKRGYAGALIEYAKHLMLQNSEKFLVLLPQEETFYDFYRKYGFCELYCSKKINKKIDLSEIETAEVQIISAKEYLSFRKSFFSGERFVKWGIKALEFMQRAYNGNFLVIRKGDSPCGAAFCYLLKDGLAVPELLSSDNELDFVKSLGIFYGKSNVFCICASKEGTKFAMIYPSEYSDTYFGLGMK